MDWVDSPKLLEMYAQERCLPEHLYPSEARFLPELAATHASLLDCGCAAGGFADIWLSYNPNLRYTGVDLSPVLLDEARRRHPGLDFRQGNLAEGIDLPDGCSDLVAALGWLHWEPRWRAALRELWRLAGATLFFDVRLHPQRGCQGEQHLDAATVTPYVVVAWAELQATLDELGPGSLRAFGYWGAPRGTRGVPERVCMATFVLERRPGSRRLELPFL